MASLSPIQAGRNYKHIFRANIDFLILLIYLARKPFLANISIFWFYWYISLENLFEWINQFFDFIDISRSKTFPSKYIDFLILSIYLAQKPFRANILIFWFYQYISLENLSERIYWFFDFIDVSRFKTFPSEFIDFLILTIYPARKPFWANILNFSILKCFNFSKF